MFESEGLSAGLPHISVISLTTTTAFGRSFGASAALACRYASHIASSEMSLPRKSAPPKGLMLVDLSVVTAPGILGKPRGVFGIKDLTETILATASLTA